MNVTTLGGDSTPDFGILSVLHRGAGGWVNLSRKDPGRKSGFDPGTNVRVEDLIGSGSDPGHTPLLPIIREWLTADAYVTLNLVKNRGRGTTRSKGLDNLPAHLRGNDHVAYLSVAWVDLDFYGKRASDGRELGLGTVFEGVMSRVADGTVPVPSAFLMSGRGLWTFWLLRDDQANLPVDCTPWTRNVHRAINERLASIFAEFGADQAVCDPARICRVPGSINTKSGKPVLFLVQHDPETGCTPAYRMAEMSAMLRVDVPAEPVLAMRKPVDPRVSERQRVNGRKRWVYQRDKVRKLIALRGGVREGLRQTTGFILAGLLYRTGLRGTRLEEAMVRYSQADCIPPLDNPAKEFGNVLRRDVRVRRYWSDWKIGQLLNVTPAESAQCGLPAQGTPKPIARKGKGIRKGRETTRREWLRKLMETKMGEVPSVAEACRYVNEQMRPPKPIDRRTIRKDLRALGFTDQGKGDGGAPGEGIEAGTGAGEVSAESESSQRGGTGDQGKGP